MTRAEKLEAAARLIGEVAADLDRTSKDCECCGAHRYSNWDEHQMGIELDAIVRKCQSFAKKLRRS